jgi:glycosyltransferase involved in cell wall biosynthesis
VFGQGYANIAEVEDPPLRQRARTITVPLPDWMYCSRDSWEGGGGRAVFLCPSVGIAGYYGDLYAGIKRDFGHLPHVIFGRQPVPVSDPAVQPYLSDEDLLALYRSAPVFIYPSTEPRHIHYSPIEAIIVGTPVLYRSGTLMDLIAEDRLPGACADTVDMEDKAKRLVAGDRALAEAIRAAQGRILDVFASSRAREQWAAILPGDSRRSAG